MDPLPGLTPTPAFSDVLALLPPSATLEAVVQSMIDEKTFLLEALGRLIEVTADAPLTVGARITVRVEGDPARPTLRLLPPRAGPEPAAPPAALPVARTPESLLEQVGLASTPARREVAQAMLDHGVPATPENFRALERFATRAAPAPEPARLQAAAFLLARGVPALETAAEPLAGVLAAPLEVGRLLARVDAALADASGAQPLVAAPAAAPDLAAAAARVAPENLLRIENALRAEVARVLAADPVLRLLDQALDRLLAAGARPPASSAALPADLRAAIEALLRAPDPEAPLLQRLSALPPTVRDALAAFLLEREAAALDRSPALGALRQGLAALHDLSDRGGALRAVNLLHAARGESVRVFELPVTVDGRTFAAAVQVRVEDRRGRGGAGGAPASVLVRVDLSQIGLVSAAIHVQGKHADVNFRVRDTRVRKRFRAHAGELEAAFAPLGLTARVGVEVRGAGEDDWVAWLLGPRAGARPGIDVRV